MHHQKCKENVNQKCYLAKNEWPSNIYAISFLVLKKRLK